MTQTITQSVADVFSRPADSNFDSMQHLLEVAQEEMDQSRTVKVNGSDISFSAENGRFRLDITGQNPLPLTNYSMTQVAGMAKIQTHVLERLHSKDRDDLVIDNLKTLFPNSRSEVKHILVRDRFDDAIKIESTARAVNGSQYSRLWDYEVFSEIQEFLLQRGFTPMLPSLVANAMRNGLMHGLDTGLFRGDQCSFGFFFAQEGMEGDSTLLGGLKPGMMVWNSEVGAKSFGFHTFYYHEASGSIIIWTPANHKRKRFVHRGNIRPAFKEYIRTLEDTADNFKTRYEDDLEVFETARYTPFATTEDAAAERLQKNFKMSAVSAKAAVRASKFKQNSYGFLLSVWNIALGIAWEAGQTGRSESLMDDTLVATRMMRAALKA